MKKRETDKEGDRAGKRARESDCKKCRKVMRELQCEYESNKVDNHSGTLMAQHLRIKGKRQEGDRELQRERERRGKGGQCPLSARDVYLPERRPPLSWSWRSWPPRVWDNNHCCRVYGGMHRTQLSARYDIHDKT